jgi:hypothetical protein
MMGESNQKHSITIEMDIFSTSSEEFTSTHNRHHHCFAAWLEQ